MDWWVKELLMQLCLKVFSLWHLGDTFFTQESLLWIPSPTVVRPFTDAQGTQPFLRVPHKGIHIVHSKEPNWTSQ